MEEEREMCQNCKKDIPVENYRTHTLHCARNMVKCKDCETVVGRADLDNHRMDYHSLRVCYQCHVNVEAYKLPEHMKTLCSKRMLVCKYCNEEVAAFQMSKHENSCGTKTDLCERCHEWVQLSEWDSHQSRNHGTLGRRFRERSVIANTNQYDDKQGIPTVPNSYDEENPMLPCEFCEGMIPMRKLLEHQAECVNPTNVRRSESIGNISQVSTSTYRPLSGIRQYSTASLQRTTSLPRKISAPSRFGTFERHTSDYRSQYTKDLLPQKNVTESHLSNSDDQDSEKIPCEFCNEPQNLDSLMKHQRSCTRNPSKCETTSCASTLGRSYGLNRASSVRETRATTEDRTFGRSLSRQSSFTERSYSQMYTRGSLGLGRYNTGPDYAGATRRSALFDGYTGFAIYSSISQGLDEITYGGRLSRRNSITDSNYSYQRRGSVTGSAFEYSSYLAAATATNANTCSNSRDSEPGCSNQSEIANSTSRISPKHDNHKNPKELTVPLVRDSSDSMVSTPRQTLSRQDSNSTRWHSDQTQVARDSCGSMINSPKSSATLSRQNSTRYSSSACHSSDSAYESSPPSVKSSTKKDRSKMDISSKDISMNGAISRQGSIRKSKVERKVSFSGADPIVLESSPTKPRRVKDKSEKKKKVESPKNIDVLFDQVSAKLRALEQEQHENVEALPVQSTPEPPVPQSSLFHPASNRQRKEVQNMSEPTAPTTTTMNVSATVTLNGSQSCVKVKEYAPREAKILHTRDVTKESSRDVITASQATHYSQTVSSARIVSTSDASVTKLDSVVTREKSSRESKPSSKRNSLDNKSVQTLAQDLAAECAKAYALMESSLSKLSTDFAVGPFGLTPKIKKNRKSKCSSTQQLK